MPWGLTWLAIFQLILLPFNGHAQPQPIPQSEAFFESLPLEKMEQTMLAEMGIKPELNQLLRAGLDEPHEQEGLLRKFRDLIGLRTKLQNQVRFLDREKSPEETQQLMRRGEVLVEINGKGRAELNAIDEVRFTRIILENDKSAYIFMDADQYEIQPAHLKQFIARTHIASDDSNGRDLVFILHSSTQDEIIVVPHTKHRVFSGEWWKDYWRTIYEKPKLADFIMGVSLGTVLQAPASAAVGVGKVVVDSETPFLKALTDPEILSQPEILGAAGLSVVFSIFVGTVIRTYKNWTDIGAKRKKRSAQAAESDSPKRTFFRKKEAIQTLKHSVLSVAFAMSFISLVKGPEALFGFSPESAGLWMSVLFNIWLSNTAKTYWYKISEYAAKSRKVIGNVTLGKWNTGVKKDNLMQQLIYLIPFSIRLADFIDFGELNIVLFGMIPITIGKIALILSVPTAEAISLWFAYYWNYYRADELGQRWDSYRGMLFWRKAPVFLSAEQIKESTRKSKSIFEGLGTMIRQAKQGCASLLRSET